jgi:hypothetical protein
VRNPVIRAFDAVDMSRPDPRSVAALFAERQLAALKTHGSGSEDAAYEVARAWLLENGREMFGRLAVPPGVAHTMVGVHTHGEGVYRRCRALRHTRRLPRCSNCTRSSSHTLPCLSVHVTHVYDRVQERDPATDLPPKEMLEAVQEKQAALMRETLREDMKARCGGVGPFCEHDRGGQGAVAASME